MAHSKTLSENFSRLSLLLFFFFYLTSTGNAETLRFVVIGDNNGFNLNILAEIAQATVGEAPGFVIFSGDLTFGYRNTQAEFEAQLLAWRNTMQPVYAAGIDVYPCRGNHDAAGVNPVIDTSGALSKAGWDNVFSGPYALPANGPVGEENITFSFARKNIFIAGLDEYGSHPHQVNQSWLDEQLALNTQPHVFVFGHEPAFKVFHDDCLDDYPVQRNVFWNSLAAHCCRIYFDGHDHSHNHSRIDDGDGNAANDLHQYVAGSSGAPLYEWGGSYDGDNSSWNPQLVHYEQQYGYVLVEVNDLNVTVTWKHRTAPGVYEEGGDTFAYTSACNPTLINLDSFKTVPQNSKVILTWSTESEIDNAGYNLYRSTSGDGEYTKINNSLITARGSSVRGASYEFVDGDVQNRKTYYYKLEDIDLNGTSTFHGPVSETPRFIYGLGK
jgi:hypothetical protein